jgi:[protein-PII] uridylyltransferase
MPGSYGLVFEADEMARHHAMLREEELRCEWQELDDGRLTCTVVAPDQPGLLAAAAAALTLGGFDVHEAAGFSHQGGFAVEVFTGQDRFGRLADDGGRMGVEGRIGDALAGTGDLRAELRERRHRYRVESGEVRVIVDLGASDTATVVEVHAPDEVGLLATVAAVFDDLGLDVRVCKVSTIGDRVVDVFYLRAPNGAKITDPLSLDRMRATLVARLTSEYAVG